MEKDSLPAELPPDESYIFNSIIPKLTKLDYKDMLHQAQSFLETQRSTREAELDRIKAAKTELERQRKEEEERLRREEEIKRLQEEEAKRKAEEEERQRAEEERIRREEEKKRADEELAAKKAAVEARHREAMEQARLAQERRQEELRREEEARKKAIEEAEAQARAEEEKRQKEAEEAKRQLEEAERKAEEEKRAAAEAAEKAKAELAKAIDVKTIASQDEDVNEEKERELEAAMERRDFKSLDTILKDYKSQTRIGRSAAKLLKVLEEESTIIESLQNYMKLLEVEPMKELLKRAALLELSHAVINEARELTYGSKTNELLSRRINLLLEKKDVSALKVLLEEAKRDGIENSDLERAENYVKARSKQNEELKKRPSKVEIKGVSEPRASVSSEGAAAASPAAAPSAGAEGAGAPIPPPAVDEKRLERQRAYQEFLSYAGLHSLRSLRLLRKEDEYAKGKPKEIRALQIVYQKDKLPSTLLKLDSKACGGEAKSNLVKKVGKLIFQNICGYMGDRYHAYPATLAFQILTTGEKEPLLRDEIYCQIVKQTTNHPIAESEVFGWKLLYLCLQTFPPGEQMHNVLLSHAASAAPVDLPDGPVGWKTIGDLASHCWARLTARDLQYKIPSLIEIQTFTNGGADPCSLE